MATPQQAINAMCKSCVYDDQANGTWREQTEGCGIPSCPLYELRPVSAATRKQRSEERFNALSESEKIIEIEKRKAIGERLGKRTA